ncbi:uncharacterized protein LOC131160136 [Malania oleifera]|uniref:uncharacterized protein LOC131160136 n=1 Tax=Malania oleifera TaxID=397392 RepID=UPI0025ADF3F5|nr:uncharacterized protein LOC131160136 [Malania oleifera]
MSMLNMSISIPTPPHSISFSGVLTGPNHLFLCSKLSQLSIRSPSIPIKWTTIRMGGGPRTYPGGVSKWQWKRMQRKKAKLLLKARLSRERQIYEMRKRAELRAAALELERPWEPVEKAPTLLSVSADEQLKVLADRFQKPGGFDLWSDRDGPQLFETPAEEPVERFFPKGIVHSIARPYGRISQFHSDGGHELSLPSNVSGASDGRSIVRQRNGYKNSGRLRGGSFSAGTVDVGNLSTSGSNSDAESSDWNDSVELWQVGVSGNVNGTAIGKNTSSQIWKKGGRRRSGSPVSNGLEEFDSGQSGSGTDQSVKISVRHSGRHSRVGQLKRGNGSQELKYSRTEAYDMSLQKDGSYKY